MFCIKCGNEFEGAFCNKCGTPAPKLTTNQPPVAPQQSTQVPVQKKKGGFLKGALIVIGVIIGIGIIGAAMGGNGGESSQVSASVSASSAISETSTADAKSEASSVASIKFETELSSGHYTAGIDFPAGKYDIVAVKGGGNVSSSNPFNGGINAVMGVADKNQNVDMYEQEYKNVKLDDGVVLSISGVTIKISCDEASGAPLSPRNQSITETVDLGNGNFVAGQDFPAGVYDIVAVSGGGNVSSDNLFDGGINAILGTADKNTSGLDMYEQEWKNVNLPENAQLSVDGVKIQLVPSK